MWGAETPAQCDVVWLEQCNEPEMATFHDSMLCGYGLICPFHDFHVGTGDDVHPHLNDDSFCCGYNGGHDFGNVGDIRRFDPYFICKMRRITKLNVRVPN